MHGKKPKAWIMGFLIVFLLGLAVHSEAHAIVAEAHAKLRCQRDAPSICKLAVVPVGDKDYRECRVKVAQVTGLIYADEDGDGVIDQLDKCPDTPQGSPTDNHGCSAVKCDINGDKKIGLEEVIYFLQILSNQRPQ